MGAKNPLGLQEDKQVTGVNTKTTPKENKTFYMHFIISLYVCEAFRGLSILKAGALQAPHLSSYPSCFVL